MNSRKYNALISLLLIIIVGAGFAACSSKAKLPRLADDAVIVAFGNSLTFGTGAEPNENYPAVLEQMIGRRVVNAGVPGEVTGDGLSRLLEILEREKPALLLLCHGGNDQLRRLDLRQAANNIRDMAGERRISCSYRGTRSGTIPFPPTPVPRNSEGALCAPRREYLLADNSLKSDYIHPNAAGYRRLAESLVTLLKKSGAID